MRKKQAPGLPVFFAALVILSLVLFCPLVINRLYFIDYSPESFEETNAELSNPYRGWYSLHGYLLSDTQELSLPHKEAYDSSSAGLELIEINLKNYADRDISHAGLTQLDQLLSAWQDTGSQLILRFVYDWDGQNLLTEPQNLSQILRHMDQTASIVNRYPASVYLIQGIFVGNWGEMHSTRYMDKESMTELFNHLASVTDPSVFLAVRTPAQLRTILSSSVPDSSQAFNGTTQARLGLFNDGMLGSETDAGTYGSSDSVTDSSGAWSRKKELDFQNQLCSYVPNGGEVIQSNSLNDPEPAVSTLEEMHVSYLNRDYDTAVLDKWKAASYTGSDSVYQGLTAYEYISRHLGYRYVLRSSGLTYDDPVNISASLSLTLENTGFSPCYRPLDVCVNMVSASGGVTSLPVDTDLRFVQSGTTQTLKASVDLSETEPGQYHFYLKVTDPALNREILLATSADHEKYGYLLGSAEISKLPQ